ncbi:hypothetical protein BDV19DRAFT_311934 [Aspergillus venezuelensis]
MDMEWIDTGMIYLPTLPSGVGLGSAKGEADPPSSMITITIYDVTTTVMNEARRRFHLSSLAWFEFLLFLRISFHILILVLFMYLALPCLIFASGNWNSMRT